MILQKQIVIRMLLKIKSICNNFGCVVQFICFKGNEGKKKVKLLIRERINGESA